MIFIETKNLNLKVPSKNNLAQWSEWINSSEVRKTVVSTKIPKTPEMQWKWIENELNSKSRILLEICDKTEDIFLGVASLSNIDYKQRSAQIATISPFVKNKKNRHCVYEARLALLNYALSDLSLNKIYGTMIYPENKSFLVNNMCIGFEIEGLKHDYCWINNEPKVAVEYFITRSIIDKKKIKETTLDNLLSRDNRSMNDEKLSKIISFIKVE